jgi:hypothetical protein
MSVVLVLVHEFITKSLSPRGLGIAMILLIIASGLGIIVAFGLIRSSNKVNVNSSETAQPSILSQRAQRRGVNAIRAAKILVVILLLGLLNGLRLIGRVPPWALLVGVTINLLLTTSIIWIIVKSQKRLK